MVACEEEAQQRLGGFEAWADPHRKPLPPDGKHHRSGPKRRKKNGHRETGFALRTEVYKVFGVDLTQIPGVETMALPLFSELGRDLSQWPTAAHFASGLALCPDNDISGGRALKERLSAPGHLIGSEQFS
jgi:transposase